MSQPASAPESASASASASELRSTPIFLHSLFRTGSTYLFQKFRQAGDFYCYQEPCNEELIELNLHPERLAKNAQSDSAALRHPTLKNPYFHEFYLQREPLAGLYKKSFSFDAYFTGPILPYEQRDYFQALLDNAPKRPFLQFCRSAGRVEGLRKTFGGHHAHLWREPRGQWWSYKVSDYFDAATQATYNADHLPSVLTWAREVAGIPLYRDKSVNREIRYHRQNLVLGRAGYLAFFALWLYAFIENRRHTELDICINRLQERTYSAEVMRRLALWNIVGVSFEDADVPATYIAQTELPFYQDVEMQVKAAFVQLGYPDQEVSAAFSAINAVHEMSDRAHAALASNVQKEMTNLRSLAFRHWEQVQQNEEALRQKRTVWRVPAIKKLRQLWH